MKLPTLHPKWTKYDRQFSRVSTTKTTVHEGALSKRHTKLSPKPLVHAVNPSAVVQGGAAKKGVVAVSPKATSVPVRARAMGTVRQIPTMVNDYSYVCSSEL